MSARVWQIGGLAAAGGVGYYLYNAGGDPKAAEKRAEADLSKVSASVKSHLPGTTHEVKKDSQVLAADAGAKLDSIAADVKANVRSADAKFEQYRKDAEKKIETTAAEARKEANKAVDAFDKNVQEGAAKAKSGISSWFGGK